MSRFYRDGEILDREFSWLIIGAILDDQLEVEEVLSFIPLSLESVMSQHMKDLETRDYLDLNPFVADGLTDAQRIERAKKLKGKYQKAFSKLRSHFNAVADEGD